MNTIKTTASTVALLSGLLTAYAGYSSSAPEGSGFAITGLGVLLAADSLACFYGIRYAFGVGAVLAAVFAVFASVAWSALSAVQIATILLSLVTVISSVLAFRASSKMPEQGNPMNLPVFG
ncbi:MAG: hypothetical protein LYZ66_01510 [Nitrososphaerales archaeon]|nr:hypothetical protein [Nitrososphaerales archaeon]